MSHPNLYIEFWKRVSEYVLELDDRLRVKIRNIHLDLDNSIYVYQHYVNLDVEVTGPSGSVRYPIVVTIDLASLQASDFKVGSTSYLDRIGEEVCAQLYVLLGGDSELTDDDEELD